jgi:hypothetical protein
LASRKVRKLEGRKKTKTAFSVMDYTSSKSRVVCHRLVLSEGGTCIWWLTCGFTDVLTSYQNWLFIQVVCFVLWSINAFYSEGICSVTQQKCNPQVFWATPVSVTASKLL